MLEPRPDRVVESLKRAALILFWATVILAIGVIVKGELSILLFGIG